MLKHHLRENCFHKSTTTVGLPEKLTVTDLRSGAALCLPPLPGFLPVTVDTAHTTTLERAHFSDVGLHGAHILTRLLQASGKFINYLLEAAGL